VVVAAGQGSRFGSDVPKQFLEVAGRRVVDWSVAAAAPVASATVLVVPPGHAEVSSPSEGLRIVEGADTRSGSVRSGLATLDGLADDDDVVVVHDAARPLASTALFDAVIDAVVAGADAAVPAIPVADTLKRVDVDGRVVETVDRNGLVWIQTPQAFRCGVLRAAHRGAPEATDDAGLVEAGGGVVVVVPGESANRKVTVAGDLDVVGEVLRAGVRP
jgi:2-C-methyl-D-erythritol 4-phosphate cytidylyltransferase